MAQQAIEDYRLEVSVEGEWKVRDGAGVKGNKQIERATMFGPTAGERFRLLITKTPEGQARVWEVELFERLGDIAEGEE